MNTSHPLSTQQIRLSSYVSGGGVDPQHATRHTIYSHPRQGEPLTAHSSEVVRSIYFFADLSPTTQRSMKVFTRIQCSMRTTKNNIFSKSS